MKKTRDIKDGQAKPNYHREISKVLRLEKLFVEISTAYVSSVAFFGRKYVALQAENLLRKLIIIFTLSLLIVIGKTGLSNS